MMNADGTGYMQKTIAVKIQSEAALQQLGIVGMGFAGNSQRVEFHYVRARRPDGSVTETPVSGMMEQPMQATVQAPFYSDLKIAQIPVKNLQVGDTLEWEARVVITRAEAPNEFWDAENFVTEGSVVREESVELHLPATKPVTVWTNPALGIKVKQSKDGDRTVYRWEISALKPTVGAEADAAKEAKKKHVLTADEELDEERGKLPSIAWTTFPSWAAVGEWYRGLELSRATPDDEIKAKVAELTKGKANDEDKVRAIYAYVSTQVAVYRRGVWSGAVSAARGDRRTAQPVWRLQGQGNAADGDAGGGRRAIRRSLDRRWPALQQCSSLPWRIQPSDYAPEAEWEGCVAGLHGRGCAVRDDAFGAARPRGTGGAAGGHAGAGKDAEGSAICRVPDMDGEGDAGRERNLGLADHRTGAWRWRTGNARGGTAVGTCAV